MRPVARIAQSVEQGIENPRVPGSIPGSGTIFKEPASGGFFAFMGRTRYRRFDSLATSCGSPSGSRWHAMQKCSRHFRVRAPYLENPPLAGFCVYGANPLSKVRFTRHIPVARPLGRAGTRCKNARHFRVRAPYLKNPPLAGFCFLRPPDSPSPEHSEFRLSRAHSTSQPCSNTNRFHGETNCQVCLCAALPDWHRLISCPACN